MSKRNGFMKAQLLFALIWLSVVFAGCSSNNGTDAPPTYSISGSISGDIVQGVNIAVSGAVNASVLTDASGNFSVSGLPNGSYTLTPSKAGYAFTPAGKTVVINGAGSSGNDFTSSAVLYAVNGTVTGAVQAGVTITVAGTTDSGSALSTSVTTTGGSYSVPDIPDGSYTVTPAKNGYSFTPASAAVTVSGANGSVAAFNAAVDSSVKFNLTGTVSGAVKQGVTISVTGSASGSAVTGADGTYTISNLPNGSYTVSASKAGYTFSTDLPPVIDGADSTGNDFTATAVLYSISGTVSGDVKKDVIITVSGTTENGAAFSSPGTTSSADGSYSFTNIPNGDYTVAAYKLGYLLNPVSYAVTIVGGDSQNRNFTASANPLAALMASGGTGTNGAGGTGGQVYAESYGSVTVLKSGTVDATFTAPTITPDFGSAPFTVSSDTTIVPDTDSTAGGLCQVSGASGGDGSLYIGNGDGTCDTNDTQVTGLTIAAGTTLILYDSSAGNGSLRLANDLVVNGILTTDVANSWGLSVEANLIDVEATGKITVSATTPDSSAGEVDLGQWQGITRTIINRGTIEAVGDGTGAGGYIWLEPADLVVNYGTIDVSGGNNGGSGGEFDAFVDYGDFYSSGTVRMNGGNGDTGGNTEYVNYGWYGYSCWIETAYDGNANGRNGDIIISGTWEAKGGDGASGDGGGGGYLYFQTDGIGTVTLNSSLSVKGGSGASGFSGGSAGEIDIVSGLDPYGSGGYNDPAPGTISIAGTYDLRGGDGDQNGGSGGYLSVLSQGVNASGTGSDVRFTAFPVMVMNGGAGGTNGGSASGSALGLYTYTQSTTALPITNEADIQARGGAATLPGGTGGMGGSVTLQTGTPADPATIITNPGNIDVSGGAGNSGGSAYNGGDAIYFEAEHIDNSGDLTANGGSGTNGAGGNGGNITMTSDDVNSPTSNTGTLSVTGGAGTPAGADGTTNVM